MIGIFGASSGFIFLFDVSQAKWTSAVRRGMGRMNLQHIFSEKISSGALRVVK